MSFGNDTLVFGTLVKVGPADEDGNYQMVPDTVAAPGCRHRPLTFKETAELEIDIATEMWRSTIPLKDYDDALIAELTALKASAFFTVGTGKFQIVGGVRPHPDMASVPYKMTIISQRQHG